MASNLEPSGRRSLYGRAAGYYGSVVRVQGQLPPSARPYARQPRLTSPSHICDLDRLFVRLQVAYLQRSLPVLQNLLSCYSVLPALERLDLAPAS